MRTLIIKVTLGAALIAALWFLQLSLALDIVLCVGCVLIIIATSARNLARLCFGLWLGISGSYLLLGTLHSHLTHYYREHEKYAIPGGPYKPNVQEVIDQPHGDLVAIDPALPRHLWEPRKVEFITDSRGYRNRTDFSGERHILVGDSFLVGNGVTQGDILPEVLRKRFGIRAYAMAYPSDPVDYERRAYSATQDFGRAATFSFFFFEGNDFWADASAAAEVRSYSRRYDDMRLVLIRELFGSSTAPETWYKIIRQATRRLTPMRFRPTTIGNFGTLSLAHYNEQTAVAVSASPGLQLRFPSGVWERTACVFFIPTKARVYPETLPERARKPAYPAPALLRLKEALKNYPVAVVDLTESLMAARDRLGQEGKLLFWKDDTHWNAEGMRVVAPEIARCLNSRDSASAAGIKERSSLKE